MLKVKEFIKDSRRYESLESDQAFWSDFFYSEGEKIFRYLLSIVQDQKEAEDCLQETFEKFFTHIGTYDPERPLTPYLMIIARHVAYNNYRKNCKVTSLDEKSILDSYGSIDRALQQVDLQETVERIIMVAGLDEIQAKVFSLSVLHALQPTDIASIMDKSPKNIRQILWRARVKMREIIDRGEIVL